MQHLHSETNVLAIKEHLLLHGTLLRNKTQSLTHPLHTLNNPTVNKKIMKDSIFINKSYRLANQNQMDINQDMIGYNIITRSFTLLLYKTIFTAEPKTK